VLGCHFRSEVTPFRAAVTSLIYRTWRCSQSNVCESLLQFSIPIFVKSTTPQLLTLIC
jgi:hypothetical protein